MALEKGDKKTEEGEIHDELKEKSTRISNDIHIDQETVDPTPDTPHTHHTPTPSATGPRLLSCGLEDFISETVNLSRTHLLANSKAKCTLVLADPEVYETLTITQRASLGSINVMSRIEVVLVESSDELVDVILHHHTEHGVLAIWNVFHYMIQDEIFVPPVLRTGKLINYVGFLLHRLARSRDVILAEPEPIWKLTIPNRPGMALVPIELLLKKWVT